MWRIGRWRPATRMGFDPQVHQPLHSSGGGKLLPHLFEMTAALARYVGRLPRVIIKARYASNHLTMLSEVKRMVHPSEIDRRRELFGFILRRFLFFVLRFQSGVEFAIPLSLEAHPMKLDDTAPENPREDILRDDDGVPYCYLCNSVLKTWQGYEYHIMAVHLKYRPYRCMYCMKEYFYTEEEGLSHVRSQHHGKTVTLLREYHDEKEKQLDDAFCALFLAVREGVSFLLLCYNYIHIHIYIYIYVYIILYQ
ncbi:unnamed protein product [Angiostrongylus costaricensis]|uniref:C2H2-type domain-containing protein n=1 Tax=Angiostrongylus costaricensis TaxID=334426 RepID=A0A0R3PER2_ANGCS|nr:unnamed protein product [Angiostrongylus costaricensis]